MIRLPNHAPILTADAMRAAEQACFDAGTSQGALMQRAGAAVAREAARFALGRPILVLAGPGNSGGDAWCAAEILRSSGHDVMVAALGEAKEGAAAEMRDRWSGATVTLGEAKPRPVVVDGLFGTGMSRPLDGDLRAQVHKLCEAAEFSLAIDLPSGLNTDTGADLGAPHVSATVALGALKPAHVLMPGLAHCDAVLLADIGIGCDGDMHTLGRPRLTAPDIDSHKYSRGLVVVVEGEMPGAAHLAARAAMHGGAGYVMLAGKGGAGGRPDALVRRDIADVAAMAKLLDDDRIAAVLVGPGLGRDERARSLLDTVLASAHALVVDGDALTLLGESAMARIGSRSAATIMTPHAGEFSRMFDSGSNGKIAATRNAARKCGATIVHKGPDTVIAHPDGSIVAGHAGDSWLSTAGSGDVLAGLCGARLAVAGEAGAAEAVWLHGEAARQAGPAFIADDLIGQIPAAIGDCL